MEFTDTATDQNLAGMVDDDDYTSQELDSQSIHEHDSDGHSEDSLSLGELFNPDCPESPHGARLPDLQAALDLVYNTAELLKQPDEVVDAVLDLFEQQPDSDDEDDEDYGHELNDLHTTANATHTTDDATVLETVGQQLATMTRLDTELNRCCLVSCDGSPCCNQGERPLYTMRANLELDPVYMAALQQHPLARKYPDRPAGRINPVDTAKMLHSKLLRVCMAHKNHDGRYSGHSGQEPGTYSNVVQEGSPIVTHDAKCYLCGRQPWRYMRNQHSCNQHVLYIRKSQPSSAVMHNNSNVQPALRPVLDAYCFQLTSCSFQHCSSLQPAADIAPSIARDMDKVAFLGSILDGPSPKDAVIAAQHPAMHARHILCSCCMEKVGCHAHPSTASQGHECAAQPHQEPKHILQAGLNMLVQATSAINTSTEYQRVLNVQASCSMTTAINQPTVQQSKLAALTSLHAAFCTTVTSRFGTAAHERERPPQNLLQFVVEAREGARIPILAHKLPIFKFVTALELGRQLATKVKAEDKCSPTAVYQHRPATIAEYIRSFPATLRDFTAGLLHDPDREYQAYRKSAARAFNQSKPSSNAAAGRDGPASSDIQQLAHARGERKSYQQAWLCDELLRLCLPTATPWLSRALSGALRRDNQAVLVRNVLQATNVVPHTQRHERRLDQQRKQQAGPGHFLQHVQPATSKALLIDNINFAEKKGCRTRALDTSRKTTNLTAQVLLQFQPEHVDHPIPDDILQAKDVQNELDLGIGSTGPKLQSALQHGYSEVCAQLAGSNTVDAAIDGLRQHVRQQSTLRSVQVPTATMLPPGGNPQDSNDLKAMLIKDGQHLGLIDEDGVRISDDKLVVVADQAIYKRVEEMGLSFVEPKLGPWHLVWDMMRVVIKKYSAYGIYHIAKQLGVTNMEKLFEAGEFRPTERVLWQVYATICQALRMRFPDTQDLMELQKAIINDNNQVMLIHFQMMMDIGIVMLHKLGFRAGDAQLQIEALQAFLPNFPIVAAKNYADSALRDLYHTLKSQPLRNFVFQNPGLANSLEHFQRCMLKGHDEYLEEVIKGTKQSITGVDISPDIIIEQLTFNELLTEDIDHLRFIFLGDATACDTPRAMLGRTSAVLKAAEALLAAWGAPDPATSSLLQGMGAKLSKAEDRMRVIYSVDFGTNSELALARMDVFKTQPRDTTGRATAHLSIVRQAEQAASVHRKTRPTAAEQLSQSMMQMCAKVEQLRLQGKNAEADVLFAKQQDQMSKYNLTISSTIGEPHMVSKSTVLPDFLSKSVAVGAFKNALLDKAEHSRLQGTISIVDAQQLLIKYQNRTFNNVTEMVDTIYHGTETVTDTREVRRRYGLEERFRYCETLILIPDDRDLVPAAKGFTQGKRSSSSDMPSDLDQLRESLLRGLPVHMAHFLSNRHRQTLLVRAMGQQLLHKRLPPGKVLVLDFKGNLTLPTDTAPHATVSSAYSPVTIANSQTGETSITCRKPEYENKYGEAEVAAFHHAMQPCYAHAPAIEFEIVDTDAICIGLACLTAKAIDNTPASHNQQPILPSTQWTVLFKGKVIVLNRLFEALTARASRLPWYEQVLSVVACMLLAGATDYKEGFVEHPPATFCNTYFNNMDTFGSLVELDIDTHSRTIKSISLKAEACQRLILDVFRSKYKTLHPTPQPTLSQYQEIQRMIALQVHLHKKTEVGLLPSTTQNRYILDRTYKCLSYASAPARQLREFPEECWFTGQYSGYCRSHDKVLFVWDDQDGRAITGPEYRAAKGRRGSDSVRRTPVVTELIEELMLGDATLPSNSRMLDISCTDCILAHLARRGVYPSVETARKWWRDIQQQRLQEVLHSSSKSNMNDIDAAVDYTGLPCTTVIKELQKLHGAAVTYEHAFPCSFSECILAARAAPAPPRQHQRLAAARGAHHTEDTTQATGKIHIFVYKPDKTHVSAELLTSHWLTNQSRASAVIWPEAGEQMISVPTFAKQATGNKTADWKKVVYVAAPGRLQDQAPLLHQWATQSMGLGGNTLPEGIPPSAFISLTHKGTAHVAQLDTQKALQNTSTSTCVQYPAPPSTESVSYTLSGFQRKVCNCNGNWKHSVYLWDGTENRQTHTQLSKWLQDTASCQQPQQPAIEEELDGTGGEHHTEHTTPRKGTKRAPDHGISPAVLQPDQAGSTGKAAHTDSTTVPGRRNRTEGVFPLQGLSQVQEHDEELG